MNTREFYIVPKKKEKKRKMLPLNEYSAIICLLSDTKNCSKLFRNRSFIEVDPFEAAKV